MKLLAAVSIDGAIGNDDKLLWHIPEDFKRYKERTIGNICIVGFNTYESLPIEALKNRTHIVVSGNYGDKMRGIDAPENTQPRYRSTLKEAIDTANKIKKEGQEIFIIGGAQLYESSIDLCDVAEITWVNKTFPKANKRFPIDKLFKNFGIIGDSNWLKSECGLMYKFTRYIKEIPSKTYPTGYLIKGKS